MLRLLPVRRLLGVTILALGGFVYGLATPGQIQATSSCDSPLCVHYHRCDGDYCLSTILFYACCEQGGDCFDEECHD